MTICPKCGQQSSSDKVCSNCWTDLMAKPREAKPSRDLTQIPLKSILLWIILLVGFGIILNFAGQMMKSIDRANSSSPGVGSK